MAKSAAGNKIIGCARFLTTRLSIFVAPRCEVVKFLPLSRLADNNFFATATAPPTNQVFHSHSRAFYWLNTDWICFAFDEIFMRLRKRIFAIFYCETDKESSVVRSQNDLITISTFNFIFNSIALIVLKGFCQHVFLPQHFTISTKMNLSNVHIITGNFKSVDAI